MPAKPTVRIIDVRDIPSREPDRVGKLDRVVTYSVGPERIHATKLPVEDFTEEKLKARIRAEIAERGDWLWRELEI